MKKNGAMGDIRIGQEFAVKYLFHIDPVYEYPYKVVFLEPLTNQEKEHEGYDLD